MVVSCGGWAVWGCVGVGWGCGDGDGGRLLVPWVMIMLADSEGSAADKEVALKTLGHDLPNSFLPWILPLAVNSRTPF